MEHMPVSDLSRIVKAYDVRGVVPDQLNETVARALGTDHVETEVRPDLGHQARPGQGAAVRLLGDRRRLQSDPSGRSEPGAAQCSRRRPQRGPRWRPWRPW